MKAATCLPGTADLLACPVGQIVYDVDEQLKTSQSLLPLSGCLDLLLIEL